MEENLKLINRPKILVLHSSLFKTSNTLMLWRMVKDNFTGEDINEFHVEKGTVVDCRGCSYKTLFSIVVSGNSGSDCIVK